MRRTSISLAIIAVFLTVPAMAQQRAPMPPTPPIDQQPYPTAEVIPSGTPTGVVGGAALAPQPEPSYPASQDPQNVWGPEKSANPAVSAPGGGLYSVGPCDEVTGDGYCCPKEWYLDQRVRFMYHPNPRKRAVGQIGVVGVSQEFNEALQQYEFVPKMVTHDRMSASAAALPVTAGYDVTFGHHLGRDEQNRDHFVEFSYYGGNTWDQASSLQYTDTIEVDNTDTIYPNSDKLPAGVTATYKNLFSPSNPDIAGFNRADNQDIRYTSRFDNFELNYRLTPRTRQDRLVLQKNGRWRREAQTGFITSTLFGLRGMSLDESFRFFSEGTIDFTGNPSAHTTGTYDIHTRNDMVGLQIGGDCTWRKGPAEAGLRAKGGAFFNFADQHSIIQTTGAANDLLSNQIDLDEHESAHEADIAGVIEFGLTTSYQLRRNMTVHAGYDLMWINGLALAPEQTSFHTGDVANLKRNGLLMMQSLSLGLEINW